MITACYIFVIQWRQNQSLLILILSAFLTEFTKANNNLQFAISKTSILSENTETLFMKIIFKKKKVQRTSKEEVNLGVEMSKDCEQQGLICCNVIYRYLQIC